jgi:hypothetical protein
VRRRQIDFRLAGDRTHRGAVEAEIGEQFLGRVEDPLLRIARRDSRCLDHETSCFKRLF